MSNDCTTFNYLFCMKSPTSDFTYAQICSCGSAYTLIHHCYHQQCCHHHTHGNYGQPRNYEMFNWLTIWMFISNL